MVKPISNFGKYIMLMGRVFARPERFRMYFKQYVNEMAQLGINSIGIVLLISFFIGAVICIQIKLNIESPWMPRFVVGYTTREILLLEFSSSIMCLILAGKVGSNIASELGTMRVTQQIDALDIMMPPTWNMVSSTVSWNGMCGAVSSSRCSLLSSSPAFRLSLDIQSKAVP